MRGLVPSAVRRIRVRGGDAAWFPNGYEGAVTDDEVDAWVANVEASLKAEKDTLLSYSGSVIYRKPSRVRLGSGPLRRHRGAEAAAGREIRAQVDVESYGMYGMDLVHPEGPEVAWTAGMSDPDSDTLQGRSYYVLAPAGSVWTSGRTLEALTFGAIPVVDRHPRPMEESVPRAVSIPAGLAHHRRRHLCVCGRLARAARDADRQTTR